MVLIIFHRKMEKTNCIHLRQKKEFEEEVDEIEVMEMEHQSTCASSLSGPFHVSCYFNSVFSWAKYGAEEPLIQNFVSCLGKKARTSGSCWPPHN